MSKSPKVPAGHFVWYELMTTDTDGAKAFYQDVVDWTTQPFDASPEPYSIWMNGAEPRGGLMELPAEARKMGAPPCWVAYVSTPDTDATVEKAKRLGANVVHGPMSIPTVGRMCMLTDPQGAMFAVYTPEEHTPGGDWPRNPGDFSWHELLTTDAVAAFAFYSDLFGWEKTSEFDMGPMGIYQLYGLDGDEYGGMFNKSDDMPGPPNWLLYAMVPDIDSAVERVKKNGGQILNGPMEVPGGDMVVQCMDPQGGAFALHAKAAG
jgi:predicted enzyme related to lactoylglutathione lyase